MLMLKKSLPPFSIFISLLAPCSFAQANTLQALHYKTPTGEITVPVSSIPQPGRAHSNYVIFHPKNLHTTPTPAGETPASIACVYGLASTLTPGCPINGTQALPKGQGAGVIIIVDPYDDPNAESDLNTFSNQFGLPACTVDNGCFQQLYDTGVQPATANADWQLEMALDIEWAHAMAPNANIILYEAADLSSLISATFNAGAEINGYPGGVISNSWGFSESTIPASLEQQSDASFQQFTNVVYFFATGD